MRRLENLRNKCLNPRRGAAPARLSAPDPLPVDAIDPCPVRIDMSGKAILIRPLLTTGNQQACIIQKLHRQAGRHAGGEFRPEGLDAEIDPACVTPAYGIRIRLGSGRAQTMPDQSCRGRDDADRITPECANLYRCDILFEPEQIQDASKRVFPRLFSPPSPARSPLRSRICAANTPCPARGPFWERAAAAAIAPHLPE